MQLPLSTRSAPVEHPALASRDELRATLDAAPAPIFLTDRAGAIRWRNLAAQHTLRLALADVGEDGMNQLRTRITQVIRASARYPDHEVIEVDTGGRRLAARCLISEVPGGFAVTWDNITSELEQNEVTSRLADEVASSGSTLDALGSRLEEAAGAATARSESLAQGARELFESVREIAAGAARAADGAEQASTLTTDASGTVEQLVDSTTQIAAIADIIRGIAEQTNLLALNATIEAARAGAAGSGFAVVAGEVKDLARRTAEATERIRGLVEAVQGETSRASGAMTRIVEMIRDVADQQASIAGAVEQQSAVAAAMEAGIQDVTRASAETLTAAQGAQDTASRLSRHAEDLRSAVAARRA